jgi:hypothetical protein
VERGQQFPLRRRQGDVRPVTTFEPQQVDRHLLALELRRDAQDGDDDVRLFCGGDAS